MNVLTCIGQRCGHVDVDVKYTVIVSNEVVAQVHSDVQEVSTGAQVLRTCGRVHGGGMHSGHRDPNRVCIRR